MPYCSACGTKTADNDTFCPACGKSLRDASAAGGPPVPTSTSGASTGLADNVAGLLAYVTIIPAIVFLVLEPYSKRQFVRFHAFQSIFLWVACVAAGIGLSMLGMLPVIRWVALFIWPLLGLAELVIWLLCLLKAYQGQLFKLPVIGDLAEKQAGGTSGSQANAA